MTQMSDEEFEAEPRALESNQRTQRIGAREELSSARQAIAEPVSQAEPEFIVLV